MKGNQKRYELEFLEQLRGWLPGVRAIVLADRGFGDQKLYDFLLENDWDYVIRFRDNILVTSKEGERKTARKWVSETRRPRKLVTPCVTADQCMVPAVVVAWDRRMKDPWCLATSLDERTAREIVKLYGRRFTIEETFRDQKDLHFGMGLSATHMHSAQRRDRLLLLVAIAIALLTMLGEASEQAGLDRYLKVNTVKRRTHSLLRQGLYWYHAIPNCRREWLVPLMAAFDRIVRERAILTEIFGVI